MKLTPAIQKFIVNWSGIAASWGLNRTVAQIHALLLASPHPLTAEEMKAILQVARSNVSVSLRTLEDLGLIHSHSVVGDRRKRFEAVKDVKEMFKRVMTLRRRKEFEGTLRSLHQITEMAPRDPVDKGMQQQIHEIRSIYGKLDMLYGKMIDEI